VPLLCLYLCLYKQIGANTTVYIYIEKKDGKDDDEDDDRRERRMMMKADTVWMGERGETGRTHVDREWILSKQRSPLLP
jgi:hypothetical protein